MYTSAASERNKQPILNVMQPMLPEAGLIFEVASGGGQHVAFFAQHNPGLQWQPTEIDQRLHASIRARAAGLDNVHPPLALDVRAPWPQIKANGVIVANMFHIAPIETVRGFFHGAASVLVAGGFVQVYGPFRPSAHSAHMSEGNERFDQNLQAQNPAWGIRCLDDVMHQAEEAGLVQPKVTPMPANNLMLHWRLA